MISGIRNFDQRAYSVNTYEETPRRHFCGKRPAAVRPEISFSGKIYPALEQAGCRNCHNVEGVACNASHFPPEDAAKLGRGWQVSDRIVDRRNPNKSVLLLKPTLRIPTPGSVFQRQSGRSSTEILIGYLASLSGSELAEALRYWQEDAHGYGVAPTAVLRRLTHSQYNNTVRDLLKDTSNPASQFPTEDYVNGFKNQYQALSVSPILTEAYSLAAERLAANAFRRGDLHGLIPCKPASDDDAACKQNLSRHSVVELADRWKRKRFMVPGDFQTEKNFRW
jgi:hypothetical protein